MYICRKIMDEVMIHLRHLTIRHWTSFCLPWRCFSVVQELAGAFVICYFLAVEVRPCKTDYTSVSNKDKRSKQYR